MPLRTLFVLWGFLLAWPALAEPVPWGAHSHRISAAHYVEYWRDDDQNTSMSEVLALGDQAWRRNTADEINLGYTTTPHWFRTSLVNQSNQPLTILLELAYPVLDYVDVYLIRDGLVVRHYEMGDKVPFYERPIKHRHFAVPLEAEPGEVLDILLRVQTTSSLQVPLTFWRPDTFFAANQSISLFEGMYYGIFVVMVLYNLFVFLAVGERSFLYYVGFITAMPLFIASLHGVSFQYLWPNAVWWNDQAIIFFLSAVVVFITLFAKKFMAVRDTNHRVLNRIMLLMVGIGGLGVFSAFLVPYGHTIRPTILVAGFGCLMILVVGIVRAWQGNVAARYFTTAWLVMLFGGIMLALSKVGAIPRNGLTENSVQVGSAIGVILLSMALADRLNREKKAAFEAQQRLFREERKVRLEQEKSLQFQQEANALLEQRVQERTKDLETLNQRLQELNATDALTGLRNRGHFDQIFTQACVKGFRFARSVSLLVLDIDHFKKFNDTYGHLVGDDCLQMVADCIKHHVTRPQDLAARYGGEEFVVLLPDTPQEGAVRVAERIRKELESTDFRVGDKVLRLTLSIGVATAVPKQADITKSLFKAADSALYEAKEAGRNRVAIYADTNEIDIQEGVK
ncbi:MAG: diguanylate cyclase [Marinobacter sp.]|nr:diguanylate cyclase [Marinobacter sp.]